MRKPTIHHHLHDLPADVIFEGSVAIDTEAMGLNPHRDRLCVVQLGDANGHCHVVQVNRQLTYQTPVLNALLTNPSIEKIFHYGRFDIALLYKALGVVTAPVYCTKIASKLARNFTSRHGLKNLLGELLQVEISKQAQTSDWGQPDLTPEQLTYAATDVLYLHDLKAKLNILLEREGRLDLAQKCFDFLPTVAQLDLLGYDNLQVFSYE
jgi:ribonuclease D